MVIGRPRLRPRPAHPARAALSMLLATLLLAGAPAGAALAGASPASAASSRLTVHTYRITPRPQRTVHSTGYATYTFNAPAGQRIFSATARLIGAQRHAVAIRSHTITNKLTRYTVNLVFPGEQGNPGKLVVRLATIP